MTDHLDGNVLAGPLSELFRDDMTTALGTCAHCGDTSVLALAIVYTDGPGWLVRCHTCHDVLMTVVGMPGRHRLDMRGLSALDFAAR